MLTFIINVNCAVTNNLHLLTLGWNIKEKKDESIAVGLKCTEIVPEQTEKYP